MAIFDGKKIRGVLGNHILKSSADKKNTIIQRKPYTVKQTKSSQHTAGIFGKASSLAKMMRYDLGSITSGYSDRGMVNRFTTLNRAILEHCYDPATKTFVFEEDSFNRLAGFEFDANSPLGDYFWMDPLVSWDESTLRINIPAFETGKQLKFPGTANAVKLKIEVGVYNFDQFLQRQSYFREVDILLSQGLVAEQEFIFEVPEGCFCVSCFGLEYFYQYSNVNNSLNSKALSPARVLSAIITPGTFVLPVVPIDPHHSVGSVWHLNSALRLNPPKV